jgi:phosphate transport system substrate-binding protein
VQFLRCIGFIFLAALVISCSPQPNEAIVIRGSNTIGEELAPRLIAEFKKDHPRVAFDTEFKGTSYGLGALMVERCDIAAASRNITTNELALAADRSIAFNDYVIGDYCVAVIINAANPVTNLTKDQVRDVFSGTIKNWKDLGGPDAAIHLYIRDPISGTYLGFQEVAMEKQPYSLGVKAFTNHTAIIQAVAQDSYGIGYSSINLAKKGGVKTVSIAGVSPTVETVNKGQYPYARVLRFYTEKSKETSAAKGFIDFVQSPRGQAILEEMGFVRRP